MSQPDRGTPPFWIKAASDGDSSIDERVWKSAKEIWEPCFRLARYYLADELVAAQILEGVAIQVSARLRQDERVARNLRGYLMASFVHEVGSHAKCESRIRYQGLARDLERDFRPLAPDFLAYIEHHLMLEAVIARLSQPGRLLLNFRLLGFSWNDTAAALGITAKQARSRFYYSLEKAAAALGLPHLSGRQKGEREV